MYLLAVFVGLLFVSAKFHRLRVERQRAQGKVVEQQRHDQVDGLASAEASIVGRPFLRQ